MVVVLIVDVPDDFFEQILEGHEAQYRTVAFTHQCQVLAMLLSTRANAQQEADQLRGQGEAERNRIFAEAYGKDPEFFAFTRSLTAYQTALTGTTTTMVLNPTGDFFRYLQKRGQIAPDEMYRAFNMGIGLIVACAARDAERVTTGDRQLIANAVATELEDAAM